VIAEVEDEGPGLARTDNLWIPFFTTKPGGTGLGLVLSRDIVENHGGSIALENRNDGHGCVASFSLPLDTPALVRHPPAGAYSST
jgi:signal transduction histidine kinase